MRGPLTSRSSDELEVDRQPKSRPRPVTGHQWQGKPHRERQAEAVRQRDIAVGPRVELRDEADIGDVHRREAQPGCHQLAFRCYRINAVARRFAEALCQDDRRRHSLIDHIPDAIMSRLLLYQRKERGTVDDDCHSGLTRAATKASNSAG